MRSTFKNSFYGGALLAFMIGLWLARLWQPENQVRLHSEHLVRQVEKRNWSGTGNLVALDYRDDWGNDRSLLLTRLRMTLRFFSSLTITASDARTHVAQREGSWSAKILLAGNGSEGVSEITMQVNSLTTPFELHWRRRSRWPWDWLLVRVSNPALEIPRDYY